MTAMADSTTPQPSSEPGDQPQPAIPEVQTWPADPPKISMGPIPKTHDPNIYIYERAKAKRTEPLPPIPEVQVWQVDPPDYEISIGPMSEDYWQSVRARIKPKPYKPKAPIPEIQVWPVELPGRHPVREKWRDSWLRQVFAASGLKLRGLMSRIFVAPRLKLRHQETKG